ncbi:MAG: transglycosylase SLT domain-containing protein [Thermodesulfovibrionales bacterium]|nr:transglycosylase SLT domain-containing protein [Thermodesulfovibrionales bacterium]
MKLCLLCLLLFTLHCSLIYGGEIDGKALLKKGKDELEGKRYEEAIQSLSVAEKEFPLLGDYALLWLSEAYQEKGNHGESLKTIRTLLARYPDSPLRKKARAREIKMAEEVSEETVQNLFESFVRDYTDDTEMRYLYAQWLKKKDKIDGARSLFREIYAGAGPFSELAYNELISSDIRVEDLIERASNLMKLRNFKGAESALRSALEKGDGRFKNEILKGLGLSLFRQKRYLEAAEVYERANERFWRVRSLYRAGVKEVFSSALEELLKMGDKRAGPVLITVASDNRREGKIDEAIKTYQNVIERYPLETEGALWGIGWTYFLTGEYGKAADVFTKLYEVYNNTKYLYWKARSLEASGEDALDMYHTLKKKGRDFYSVMSCMRTERCLEKSDNVEIQKPFTITTQSRKTTFAPKKFDRIETLFELGLSKEGLSELIYISKVSPSIEDIAYMCSKFQELGEYNYMVNLLAKTPYREALHHLRYPRAYWDTVEAISKKYSVDPLLVLSIIREESMFDPDARSIAGALGLMQLIPKTAFRLDSNLQLGTNNTSLICNIKNNIHVGTYYLSILIKEFGSYTYALAAYNAGEENVRRWIQKGNYKSVDEFIEDIPYTETRNYVKRVITTFLEYKRLYPPEEGWIRNPIEKL